MHLRVVMNPSLGDEALLRELRVAADGRFLLALKASKASGKQGVRERRSRNQGVFWLRSGPFPLHRGLGWTRTWLALRVRLGGGSQSVLELRTSKLRLLVAPESEPKRPGRRRLSPLSHCQHLVHLEYLSPE